MPRRVEIYAQTTSVASVFVGLAQEIIADTGLNTLRLHDGATPGGFTVVMSANNLSDLASASLARTNLGVSATGADTSYNLVANNLSDVANAATARTNLGISATGTDTTYLFRANNLSDLVNAGTARTNLGLGTSAVVNLGTSGATIPLLNGANTWAATNIFSGIVGVGALGVGTATPSSAIDIVGTATVAARTITINGTPALYIPDQSIFLQSIFVGGGGQLMTHTTSVDGQFNTAFGIGALLQIRGTGNAFGNTAIGCLTLASLTTGHDNTVVGYAGMVDMISGVNNVGVGPKTLYTSTDGNDNVALGSIALFANVHGSRNLAGGSNALSANLSDDNVGLGHSAFVLSTTASRNSGFGGFVGPTLIDGIFNTFGGFNTGSGIVSGNYNTILGAQVVMGSDVSNTVVLADGLGNAVFTANASTGVVVFSGRGITWGPGGTSNAVVNYALDGGSGAGGGAFIALKRNGVVKGYLGHDSAVNGSASPSPVGDTIDLFSTSLIDLYTNSALAVRITTAKHVLIGTTTDSAFLTVGGTAAITGALTYGGVTLSNSVTGTGSMALSIAPTFAGATFSAAITYGGVTLSNAVTGTGNLVLSNAPTFTGGINATTIAFTGGSLSGNLVCTASGTIRFASLPVGSLPSAATAGAGARFNVGDATVIAFGSVVTGGGSNPVPVYSDGANWRMG